MSIKLDFTTTLESYRARTGRFDRIEVPDTSYLMVHGAGGPNTVPAFTAAIETLHPVACTLAPDHPASACAVPPVSFAFRSSALR
ncbi:hypothetical protein [Brevibacterium luteolum]|uniref:hypothetical protein n=1 Tax=Brevibacterium luteolum TaxID=199591 RepID=UPI00223BBF6F|nr:hypothetical protein [Brevibacterium luteolum]MCT1873267.1 hypothetical protein [Brevibacterium luteolum]MCT1889928.1 hypothetical protein [Brevibacterium luteolum]MCT1892330.1 hypothetical protein [Brevibacterium luteolum]MCT1923593.1 hypothetical protein [Brevibacterium luteolum]